MKEKVITFFLAASIIMSVSGCQLDNFLFISRSENVASEDTVSGDDGNNIGTKNPDDAKSFKEYVELRFGPVAGNFDDEITVDDDKSWGILEDKEYGFQYMINLDNGAEYKECNTNFTKQYKSYIRDKEDEALDAIEAESGVSLEFNFLDSEFIIAKLVLDEPSKAPELTEKIGKIYEKYDNRHYFDQFLVIATDSGENVIGTYLLWHEYEAEK